MLRICLKSFVNSPSVAQLKFHQQYCNKRLHSPAQMVISIFMLHIDLTCTLHNDETLEPLTWARVRPSHCYEYTIECSHVLWLAYLSSVNIQDSNWTSISLFCILSLATVLTLTMLYPTLPVHSTRSYAQLLQYTLYSSDSQSLAAPRTTGGPQD